MEFRPYFLGREWIKQGHQVTIVASSYSHLRRKQPVISGLISHENFDGIDYIWLYGKSYDGNGMARAINIFQYVLLAFWVTNRILKSGFDVIITSSTHPLDIFPALYSKIRLKIKLFVYEPHDLWPMALTELGGLSRWHPFVLLNSLGEYLSVKFSDIIISMHPGNILHLVKRGANPHTFHHIPNGINLEDWISTSDLGRVLASRLDELKALNKPIVMYAGSLSIANNVDLLLDAIYETRTSAQYVIVGDGPERSRLEFKSAQLKLPVVFLGQIPKREIPKALSYADICYVGFADNPLYKFGMSANKLWDYMMAEKPIILAISSCNDPVGEAGCGVTVTTGCSSDVAFAFEQIFNLKSSERRLWGKRGKKYVLENNLYSVLSAKCLELFEAGLKSKK